MNTTEETNYKQMSDEQIREEFEESVKEYATWIDKKIDINEDFLEEAEYMSFSRGELHKVVEAINERAIKLDMNRLIELDRRWQKWVMGHNEPSFKLEHDRTTMPKDHWWEWIDELDRLSDQELSTL